MYECPYPHLFSPIVLAGQFFRSRIFASPTGLQYNHYANRPNNETICYFERKAIGGAASVCIGDAMVDSEIALANGAHILLDDPGARAHLSKLASTISRHGAVARWSFLTAAARPACPSARATRSTAPPPSTARAPSASPSTPRPRSGC